MANRVATQLKNEIYNPSKDLFSQTRYYKTILIRIKPEAILSNRDNQSGSNSALSNSRGRYIDR